MYIKVPVFSFAFCLPFSVKQFLFCIHLSKTYYGITNGGQWICHLKNDLKFDMNVHYHNALRSTQKSAG